MKTRNGFVSNSSSSSFIVIDKKSPLTPWKQKGSYNVGETGTTRFGWEYEKYTDSASKINFAYMQAEYANNAAWTKMLKKVILKHTGASSVVVGLTVKYNTNLSEGYIDHQSAANEGQNIEMFENEATLKAFLFGTGSYIQTDNDNH